MNENLQGLPPFARPKPVDPLKGFGSITPSVQTYVDNSVDTDIATHAALDTGVHGAGANTLLDTGDVDDTPVNGATTAPVSSNWAYDHADNNDPHGTLTTIVCFEDQVICHNNEIVWS